MGTYKIPRNLKGESRILYIFSMKALMTTGIGAFIGLVLFYLPFSALGMGTIGGIVTAITAVIGFVVGTVKIPVIAGLPFTKKIGGESIDAIVMRYFKFKKNRKVYVYTKEDK